MIFHDSSPASFPPLIKAINSALKRFFGLIFLITATVVLSQGASGQTPKSPTESTPSSLGQVPAGSMVPGQEKSTSLGTDVQNLPDPNPNSHEPPVESSQVHSETQPIQADERLLLFEAPGDYRYDPVGKRDPFRPYRDAKVGLGELIARSRNLEPLEKFDLKNMEVVAILWGNAKPKALILDGERKVHAVVKGQRIGKNDGYVADIREGEVVVIELYDLNGKIVKESVVMPIKK